ncbi:sensor histidine kinase [Amycolatopsis sp. TRM77291]
MNRFPPWLTDSGLIALAGIEAVLNRPDSPLSVAAAAVAVGALAARRYWPVAVLLLTLPAVASAGSVIATLVALYSVAVRSRSSNRYLLVGCGILTTVGYIFPGLEFDFPRSDVLLVVIYSIMSAAAPIFFGRLVHARHELALRLEDIRQAREHERQLDAQAALAKERNQLAREMHDVVSHQVSLIAVQAGALKVSTSDPAAKSVAEQVRQLSVNTLDELRHMVNLLRASGTQATELTPQPTLSDLERLVTGSGIEAQIVGSVPAGFDSAIQRTIYRTIQEALTNVRKHAPGSTATVEFAYDDELTVTVTNSPPTMPTLDLPSARHGLVGLQERAALLGGSVTAAPMPVGGFRLKLCLPLTNIR